MIDAYEIGIQLMLQEDVSAGLAVINRGLADVDRAIAATSANLAGLVREAQTATKAVAVAVNGRTAVAAAAEPKTEVSSDNITVKEAGQERARTAATIPEQATSAPEIKATGPVAPARPTDNEVSAEHIGPAPKRSEQAIAPSAPIRSAVDETIMSSQTTRTKPSELDITSDGPPAQVAPSGPRSGENTSQPVREFGAAEQKARQSVTPRPTQVAVTASVGSEHRSATAGAQFERARHPPISGPAARREQPVAPQLGVERSGLRAETAQFPERATAAAQSSSRNQNESSGGTVMLDGRQVGQWLSEHMGREASRPPAGTSFFDPRQTPAWNVSGAV